METVTLPAVKIPDTRELEAETEGIVALVSAVEIKTAEDYNKWKTYKDGELAEKEKRGLLLFNGTEDAPGPCAMAHKLWKSLTTMRDKVVTSRYTEARAILAPKLGAWWNREQDRLREEQRLREEKARADEAARLRAEGATKKEIEDVQTGKTPVALPPQAAPAPMAGRKPVDYWSAEVTDKMVLVKAVGAGKAPLAALEPNTVYLNAQAKLLKTEFNVPGVTARKETRA